MSPLILSAKYPKVKITIRKKFQSDIINEIMEERINFETPSVDFSKEVKECIEKLLNGVEKVTHLYHQEAYFRLS